MLKTSGNLKTVFTRKILIIPKAKCAIGPNQNLVETNMNLIYYYGEVPQLK
jgi:hypothetical protein